MACSCDKPTRSVCGTVWWLVCQGAVVAALLASPDVRKLTTSLVTRVTTTALANVALVHTRQIEQAEDEARQVAARQAELEAARALVPDAERNGVDRELADAHAEALAVKIAIGDGLRGLQGIRSAAEAVSTQIARSRGHEPQDRLSQAAKLRDARLAAERAARLETEVEKAAAMAREARESVATARREANEARLDADELRAELLARRVAAALAAEVPEPSCRGHTDAPADRTRSRRVVTSSYRVRTEPGE